MGKAVILAFAKRLCTLRHSHRSILKKRIKIAATKSKTAHSRSRNRIGHVEILDRPLKQYTFPGRLFRPVRHHL